MNYKYSEFGTMFATQTQILDKLLQLDDWEVPGLTEAEFASLFAKCESCGIITTTRVHSRHRCASATIAVVAGTGVVIDLTSDDEEGDEIIDLTDDCPGVIDLTKDE